MIHGYTRVSSGGQVEGSSLEDQERRIQAIATLRDEEVRMWSDPAVSGSVPLSERPAGGEMLSVIGPGDVIVAAKLDRLFRSVEDALTQSRAWRERSIDLILVDMGTESVTGSLTGRLYFTMLAAFAEFERGRINERTTDGRSAKRARGGFVGGNAPIGFKICGEGRDAILVVNPDEHEMIRWVRHLAPFDRSPTFIASVLNARGYSSRAGTPIEPAQVWRWLRRPIQFEGPEAVPGEGQVYRCYDALDRLRYIGSSKNARARFLSGQYVRSTNFTQDWYAAVEKVVVENHPTREAAFAAETEAQRTEHLFREPMSEGESHRQLEGFRDFFED